MAQPKAKILVVDDAPDMIEGLKHILTKNSFSVLTANRAEKALPIIESTEIDMVISDVQMPGMSGIELMDKAHEIKPDLPFLMITGFASVQSAVQAMKKGAYHYVSKPFNNDEILLSVNRALEAKLMQKELEELRRKVRGDSQWLGIIGHSEKMRGIFELVQRISNSSASVLIQGESGTGKELIAHAIHRCSPRNDKRFIAINTTALPETLLESELFGYYKGAFTGADADKNGLFVEASGGTLFLDEIGSMPLSFQGKLLRVIQEGEVVPLGGSEPIKIDTRIISATNSDLNAAVNDNRFRKDLLYRLNVVEIDLPTLRERMEDVPLLTSHFIKKYCRQNDVPTRPVTPPVLKMFQNHNWPGNVRELENVIHRAVAIDHDEKIDVDDIRIKKLPSEPAGEDGIYSMPYKDAKQKLLDDFQEKYVSELLDRHNGNIQRAANASELTRAAIYRIKKRLDI